MSLPEPGDRGFACARHPGKQDDLAINQHGAGMDHDGLQMAEAAENDGAVLRVIQGANEWRVRCGLGYKQVAMAVVACDLGGPQPTGGMDVVDFDVDEIARLACAPDSVIPENAAIFREQVAGSGGVGCGGLACFIGVEE